MSKIKQIQVKGTTYDVQDALFPDNLGSAGQILRVNASGTKLEYATISVGSLNTYCHDIHLESGDVIFNGYFFSSSSTPINAGQFKNMFANNKNWTFVGRCDLDGYGTFDELVIWGIGGGDENTYIAAWTSRTQRLYCHLATLSISNFTDTVSQL